MLGMKRSSSDNGLFVQYYVGDDIYHKKYSCSYRDILCFDTDDIIMISENKILFQRLHIEFKSMFKFTFQDSNIIKFLNFRIIQSHNGISIDKSQHIQNEIIESYWKNMSTKNISWTSSPFTTNSYFEVDLFN